MGPPHLHLHLHLQILSPSSSSSLLFKFLGLLLLLLPSFDRSSIASSNMWRSPASRRILPLLRRTAPSPSSLYPPLRFFVDQHITASSSSPSSYSSSSSSAASLISQRWFSAAVQQAVEEVKVVVDVSEGKSSSYLIILQILLIGVQSISVNCVSFCRCSAFLEIHPKSPFSFLWNFPSISHFFSGRNRKSKILLVLFSTKQSFLLHCRHQGRNWYVYARVLLLFHIRY